MSDSFLILWDIPYECKDLAGGFYAESQFPFVREDFGCIYVLTAHIPYDRKEFIGYREAQPLIRTNTRNWDEDPTELRQGAGSPGQGSP
ncbi:hypothetical protein GCM10009552_37710 [Rothia nasimurium]